MALRTRPRHPGTSAPQARSNRRRRVRGRAIQSGLPKDAIIQRHRHNCAIATYHVRKGRKYLDGLSDRRYDSAIVGEKIG